MKYPFEASFAEIMANPDPFVSMIFSSLESEFLVLPKGHGFIEYPDFEKAYEALKRATCGFTTWDSAELAETVRKTPLCLIVLRTILGFTPPEWAYIATRRTGVAITQGFARALDRKIRMAPFSPLRLTKVTEQRLVALIETAVQLLLSPPLTAGSGELHRLEKADTKEGIYSVQSLAGLGVPYAMLLYERLLGRPFAGHRDSVSELVGDSLESAIEDILARAGISYRKTRRAEKIPGFDQAPDFIIPDEFNPQVVIEAKITEDDGTARDKITRIQHLASLSTRSGSDGILRFEVVACIAGRGFGVRREDIKKLILATRGKVFTLKTLDRLVDYTRLREFRVKK
ncbi:MAG TPA: hypothetical protein GXX25_10745 [Desulfotomaculum sp.]|nr:hypothetical protein [Desulfotomaculum sp.]